MWEEKVIAMLKAKNQRVSPARVEMLTFFISNPKAHGLADIQRHFARAMDRVTIYRTLQAFVERRLLFKIFDKKGTALYSFNDADHKETKVHPHLKCSVCAVIVCLPDFPEEYLDKLHPYQIEDMQIFLEGTCNDCINKSK